MGGEGYCVNVPWSRGGVGDNDYIFAFEHIVLPIGYFWPSFIAFFILLFADLCIITNLFIIS